VGSGLSQPKGVALDGAGDLFIADSGLGHVVEVPAGGGPQTTVGSGLSQPSGVAVDAAGNVFIADAGLGQVVEVPAGGGPQTTVGSGLSQPKGVALDGSGDVFIADELNNRVVEVQRSQPPTLSFAPTPVGSLSSDSPRSVTIQNIGNQPLNGAVPSAVANFVQMEVSGTPPDCTSAFALAPGASCNLNIGFLPENAGSLTAAAIFTDNALNASPLASQSITLEGTGQATQTITFTQAAPASAAYNSNFIVAATGGVSGNPVTFASSGACSNAGATYTMTSGTGTCSVIANQAGNSNYAAAPQVTEAVNATQVSQIITFTVPAPATAKSGDLFTVAATGGASENPVTFTVGAGSVCTISGTATYIMTSNTGHCYIVANQPGNSNYLAAPQVMETVTAGTVTKIEPTVTFSGAPANAAYLSTFTVTTTANSGVTPTITSTTASVCTISGDMVTMKKGTGTCTVKAMWAANDYYLVKSLTQSTTATLLGTTTTITSTAPEATHPLKVEVYFIVTNGTSTAVTGNVTVTAAPGGESCTGTVTTGKCLLTFTAAGSETLTAVYAGNTDDSTSTSVGYSVTVN
jgi:hypothetical protein